MPAGFEDNPDAMAQPQNAADSAAAWWKNSAQKRWKAYQRALEASGALR